MGTRKGRLPAAQKEQRRAEVLQAVLDEILETGNVPASMAIIARRSGASKETLYAWFGDRDGLITALIETHADASAQRLLRALVPVTTTDARTVLTQYGEGLLTLLTSQPSVALNRAAMGSPPLATQLLSAGRHRIGPHVQAYLATVHDAEILDIADPADAFAELFGLVVRDTQTRVLLGEPAPSNAEISHRANVAVESFFQLHQN